MKRIKQIIEALKVLSRTPSTTIAGAWMTIQHNLKTEATSPRVEECQMLIHKIIGAVVAIAEDMEKPAKAEGEAAK